MPGEITAGLIEDAHGTVDPPALERLQRLGGIRLIHQMIDLFQEHATGHVETLCAMDAVEHLENAEHAAHSLKTSAGNLGVLRLYRLAAVMEQAAERGAVAQLQALRPELLTEFARASEQLEGVRARLTKDAREASS